MKANIHMHGIPVSKKIHTQGKFLYLATEKFYIKGVTYGTFKPQENGDLFPDAVTVEKDFNLMSKHDINCIRTYTPPPMFLLDLALKYGLKVMVGLPWEQHITFLDTAKRKKNIIQKVREDVLRCEQHPAILSYAIGNEI
jgi:beta-galactosidase/beta-glucuronidase